MLSRPSHGVLAGTPEPRGAVTRMAPRSLMLWSPVRSAGLTHTRSFESREREGCGRKQHKATRGAGSTAGREGQCGGRFMPRFCRHARRRLVAAMPSALVPPAALTVTV